MKKRLLLSVFLLPVVARSGTHEVEIVGFQFSPSSLTVAPGDTVTWIQRDGSPPTSTRESDIWTSPLLTGPGQTYSFTFDEAGEFPYYCTVHPSMLCAIAPVPMSVALDGSNERQTQPVMTTADGFGSLLLVGGDLHFNVRHEGLSAPATASHVHGPADAATSTCVLIGLAPFNGVAFGKSGSLSGMTPLSAAERGHVIDGLTYFNIHTQMHTAGEIRGQVLP